MTETSAGTRPWRLRMNARDPDEVNRASTPLELLFDLSFVVAVALAAAELHHALAAGRPGHALIGYLMVFFGIWWAWMNFTWFASAYDTDDVLYRLLTLVQMGGVLVLAAGVPAAFERFDFTIATLGYVIMRLALVAQWLRAAAEHPEGRSGTLRYTAGIAVVQAGWIGRLWLPGTIGLVAFAVLVAAELAVPAWAELTGRPTSWHPGHVTERYGLFTIIVLGEVILATTTAVQRAISSRGPSAALLLTAVAGLLLVFALWWSYFKHSATRRIRRSLRSAMFWGYGHYLLFAAVAALGAGLETTIDTIGQDGEVSALFAALTVAVPVATFLVVLGGLNARLGPGPTALGLVLLTAALVLLVTPAVPLLTLPLTVLVIAVLVALLLAYHLAAAHRGAGATRIDGTSAEYPRPR